MKNLTTFLLWMFFCFLFIHRPSLQSFSPEYTQPDQERRLYTIGAPEVDSIETGEKIICDFEGNFLIAGSFNREGLLIKRGPFDEPLWQKRTAIAGGELYWTDLLEMENKDLLAVGNCVHCYGGGTGDTQSKIYLQRFTSDGDTLGNPVILGPANKTASVYDVARLSGGGYAIAGSEYLNAWGGTVMSVYLLKEDLSQQSHYIYNDLYFAGGRGITELENGDLAFTGISFNNDSIHVVARRVSPAGTTLWNRIILRAPVQAITVVDMDLAPNGDLVLGGEIPQDSTEQDVYICRLDANTGIPIDTLIIARDLDQHLYDIEISENGSVLLAGNENTGTSYGFRSWIAVMNPAYELADEWFFDRWLFAESARSVYSLSRDGLDLAFCGRTVFFAESEVIWGRQFTNGRSVQLTSFPANRQLYARNTDTNLATVTVSGFALQGQAAPAGLRLEVRRNGELVHEEETALSYQGDTAHFNLAYALPAENAHYDFFLYSMSSAGHCLEAQSSDVVAGDVLIIQGQSNAVAEANSCFTDEYYGEVAEHPFVRVFGGANTSLNDQHWHLGQGNYGYYRSKPGNTGAWGQQTAQLISEELGIPVGVMNGAAGGQEIAYFLPDPDSGQQNTLNYNRLLQRMAQGQMAASPRFLFWFQGESDAIAGHSKEVYINRFIELYQAWKTDYPSLEKIFMIQISRWYLADLEQVLEIQEAQRQLAMLLPEVEIFSSNALDQCLIHYEFQGGYQLLGNQLYDLISAQYYEQMDEPNRHAPQIGRVVQMGDKLTLSTNEEVDILQFDPGAIAAFYPSSNTVVSGMAAGNEVILTLANEDPVGTLSYTGPVGGISPIVHNDNGIGLVCFREMEVERAPAAGFATPDTSPACLKVPVLFSNTSSENVESYQWHFPGGDPVSSNLTKPVINYTATGAYEATLIVSNDLGSDTLTQQFWVEVLQPPAAAFNFDLMENRWVSFTNLSTDFETVHWDFGDGQFLNDLSPEHQYSADGAYTVSLTVSNNCDTLTVEQVVAITTTGATELLPDDLVEVFPNPVERPSPVKVLTRSKETLHWANLYDLAGRRLTTWTLSSPEESWQIETKELESGYYVLELIFDRGVVVKRVVVQ